MPHQRYTLAYDISDKPNVAGGFQFEADIRALLAVIIVAQLFRINQRDGLP